MSKRKIQSGEMTEEVELDKMLAKDGKNRKYKEEEENEAG